MGSTRPRVNLNNIRDLQIPLAPLAEQRRIVAKLEKLLSQVDACQQRLVKLPTLLKRFRQSAMPLAEFFRAALLEKVQAIAGQDVERGRKLPPDITRLH